MGADDRDAEVLAPDWRVWLADNLAHGVPERALIDELVTRGVALTEAARQIDELRASPMFAVARGAALRAARLAQVLRLVRERSAIVPIERRADPRPDELFGRYWAAGTPFVVTDLVTRWPAFAKWSPQRFRDQLGSVEIEASVGRNSDPDYDINFAQHRERMTMAAFVDRVLAAGSSNDCYLIANNRNLEREGLAVLFDDLVLPDYLDPRRLAGSSALWFGPAGTTTSLHHDTSSILLCQIYGRKRVRLCDPCESALLEHARGVYCDVDPDALAEHDDEALHEVRVVDVELAAGEALFIPAGWWHHVVALDVSISLALNNFRRPNRLEWYKPGALR